MHYRVPKVRLARPFGPVLVGRQWRWLHGLLDLCTQLASIGSIHYFGRTSYLRAEYTTCEPLTECTR